MAAAKRRPAAPIDDDREPEGWADFVQWCDEPDHDPDAFVKLDGSWYPRERVDLDPVAPTASEVIGMVRDALATATQQTAKPAPLAISARNCESVIGLSWRETQALAQRLGVSVVQSGSKRVISAAALLGAIEQAGEAAKPLAATPEDPEAIILAKLGIK